MKKIPERTGGDEDHPEMSQIECGSVDDHPHQRHEVHGEGCLPATTREGLKNNHHRGKFRVLLHFSSAVD